MCQRRHLSRSKLPVHQVFWMGACKMFRTLKCSTVSEKKNIGPATPARPLRQSTPPSPPPTPVPSAEQISHGSTFNVLQFNANGSKLTELEAVLERNKVKVAVIRSQSSHQNPRDPASGITPQYVTTIAVDTEEDYSFSFIDR